MFKTQKVQFAIRKLKKITAVVLLSFGFLGSTAAPVLAASPQESQITEIQETQNENSAPQSGVKEDIIEKSTREIPAAEVKTEQATAPVNQAPEVSSPSQDSAPEIQQPAASSEQKTNAQPETAATQPVQPAKDVAPTQPQENEQITVSAKANTEEVKSQVPATKNSVTSSKNTTVAPTSKTSEKAEKPADNKLTITNDQDLKKFDPNFDANKLDQSHLLGIAGAFHIFGQDVILNADTNGNIAAGKLEANVDFGSRGDSHNHTQGDLYYIESGTLKQNGFRHDKNYIVLGDGFDLKIENGKVYANGTELSNVKPEEIKKATGYLDIQAELAKLSQKADDFKKQPATAGIVANFSDMNNQYIDLSGVSSAEKTIFINIPAQLLANPQPITIKGLNPAKDGAAIVLNVTDATSDKYNVSTQIKVVYNNGAQLGAGESHAHPNKLLWNFGTEATEINFSSGYFMGSVLATNATITANVNVDGNIIAKKVVINGGESHRWDLNHTLEEVQIPDQPTQPTDPTVPEEPSVPVEPEKPTEPVKPIKPEEPTVPIEPEKPTTPLEPTTPEKPTLPEQVTEPLQPTAPEEIVQPSSPSEMEQPTKAEEFTPPLAEKEDDLSPTESTAKQEETVRPLPEKVKQPTVLSESKKAEIKANQATEITKTIPLSQKITSNPSFKNRRAKNEQEITVNEKALPQASQQRNNPLAAIIALVFSAGLLALGSKKKNN